MCPLDVAFIRIATARTIGAKITRSEAEIIISNNRLTINCQVDPRTSVKINDLYVMVIRN